ncbi:class I SAM-dependent methyltransferase [Ensifer sp. T173]|uniref:Class I SAM-dependent methyltransferase n=1 Tax=Ensifer canadensis TaxID=555315 RepID=A0AAW4FW72_9HYPH|nr:class I SAM-dependent methyltransferase [Ensifer canadensis]MBM3095520.1 class I SAM-dependent methyltransferase [Ensifer canadensis]UBI79116.1 class I SAM-dependent methyltransferase [Ensifer canadensis]
MVKICYPPGHFFSPIVDPEQLRRVVPKTRPMPPKSLPDVAIDDAAMTKLWTDVLAPIANTATFSDEPGKVHRYHYKNPSYCVGDGTVLRAMLLSIKPKRMVEVGCGWSSACTMDTIEEGELTTQITFVEPFPKLLRDVLRENDIARARIIEAGVQDAPMEIFTELEAGDILFIDSTHVVKTGSDVAYELAEILPRLNPGVIIHFHDIFYPFEYGYKWIMEDNRSWNEIYSIRSFLAFNSCFHIMFFNDYMAQLHGDHMLKTFPPFIRNSGGALWLRRLY